MFPIVVSGINGFTGIVTVTINAPQGVQGYTSSFGSPLILGPPQTVIIYLYSTSPGNYTVTVTGTSGKISHSISLSLVEQEIGFSASPNPLMLLNKSATSVITLTSLNGFSGNVTIRPTLPPYLTYTVSPSPVFLSEGGKATASITFTTLSTNPAAAGIQIVVSTRPSSLNSDEALYYSMYLMTNQSLTVQSYSFTSSTNVAVNLKNNETFAITPVSYSVADSSGDQYNFNYSSPPTCCSPGTTSPLVIAIGTSCSSCTLLGSPFVFAVGQSYKVSLGTSPGYKFVFMINR